MEYHRTPYLGPLTDAALLPPYQESQGTPEEEPLPLVGANPTAARKAGNNVSGRVLSVTTNFPVVAGVDPKPILRSRRGLSSLTACLDYISDETEWENVNIAWVGEVEGQDEAMGLTSQEKRELERLLGDKMIPVWLDGASWRWREYAEQVLWPTLHYSHNVNDIAVQQAVGYSTYGWTRYVELNERYADVVTSQYREGDIIMIHDMYLFLLPQLIRKKYPDALIGLYVHSPFPSSELFRGLPQREELLYGMLNSTIIGFQSRQYIKHFISAATRLTGIESVGEKLLFDGRYVACAALPFGINVRDVLERSASKEVAALGKEISEIYADKKIIVGRDKLDSTQGIIQKLRAFGMMLELFPTWRGRVVFVQITTRTWQLAPRLEQQISQLTSYINGVYGDIHYSPIVHFSRHIDQNEYIALLQCAELGFFTPVREGASSAAVEYVLCQHMHPPSGCSLVLSEFMGISDLLAEGGQSVNPFDTIQVAYALNRALHSGHSARSAVEEDNMYKKALEHDVGNFVAQFLSTVVLHDLRHENQHYTPDADIPELVSSYKQAGRRLFLFDYDGTLTPIVRDPAAAVPSERLKKALKALSSDDKNTVWIISGRDMGFLDEHLGMFNINLSAEHGCYVKKKSDNPNAEWEDLVSKLDMNWMKVVLDVLQSYTERTEGASIERKKSAITWHYRKSDPEFGKFQASHLRAYLELTVANKYPVDVMAGKANVEIRPKLFNKGEIVRSVFEAADAANEFPEFVLCIGDDTTDEDMFRVISDQNRRGLHTIIVGPQNKLTIAKWHLNNVDKVHDMLDQLAAADSA